MLRHVVNFRHSHTVRFSFKEAKKFNFFKIILLIPKNCEHFFTSPEKDVNCISTHCREHGGQLDGPHEGKVKLLVKAAVALRRRGRVDATVNEAVAAQAQPAQERLVRHRREAQRDARVG